MNSNIKIVVTRHGSFMTNQM